MNYLAHATLSFRNEEILVGNMISDFVKGKTKFLYPAAIRKGIMLHRMIDEFTDAHSATKLAKEYFKKSAGPYAGIFVDVVYDHFLANDEEEYPGNELEVFTAFVYRALENHQSGLPQKFKKLLPFMVSQNWLYNYQFEQGIESSFGGIFRRARYLTYNAEIFQSFKTYYRQLHDCYHVFFPSVKVFAAQQFSSLINSDTDI